MQTKNNESLLLIDGMALLFRAFFATAVSGQYMLNSKGMPTNGVHGFLRHMLTAVSEFSPTHVAVCWDMGSKTFRTELFDGYKANRGEAPVELIPQFDLAKEVTAAFDIPNIGLAGYEADDCIGTLARQASGSIHVSILTGDRDILQLLDERVSVILLKKGYGNYQVHTPETFYEECGLIPRQMIDLKALMGDPSDNYPGVKGIGEKTAMKLLLEHGHIEGILANLDSLSKSHKTKIEQDLDMLHLSRRLAEIHCEVPVGCELPSALFSPNRQKVEAMLNDTGLRGISRLIPYQSEPVFE
ncbi:5'-3' exonuclease [Neobacillus notoginsengisoli]|uniref:5'-3' exonuclease n=1 Tax=Neobacillus notoginsengisoli TaxID=1578198 RepID=A0A417YY64_9BACI|nr:5'-3' exonuclease [Neobacillus notoginsengisoli]RHW42292.1 5'-3' exonuclease [Neobacillus notoginsengisoli]